MKKIGFVDYYLSEWHANNYPAWINEICQEKGDSWQVAYAWAEENISPKDGVDTAAWCRQFGAVASDRLQELCEKSDAIVILAPSDPEKHLPYAETVLQYGKPTYIDKTFAPDLATAKRIMEIAEHYHTPVFSTSALRYADEFSVCPACRQVCTTGGGSDIGEYLIHQVEMVVRLLGVGARKIWAEHVGDQWMFRVFYNDDRCAVMTFGSGMPFTAYMNDGAGIRRWKQISSNYFRALMAEILAFFENGKLPFPAEETLEAMRIREGALRAAATPGTTITLSL